MVKLGRTISATDNKDKCTMFLITVARRSLVK